MQRFAIVMMLCALGVSTQGAAEPLRFGRVSVSTRNLYIGTDFAPVLAALQTAPDISAVAGAAFTQIAQTNFPLRAQALAAEIAAIPPHLIGVQEALNFTLNGANSPPLFVDTLETLLAALGQRGLHYRVAALVPTLQLTFLFDLLPQAPGPEVIQVVGRDVILAREDVPTTAVDFRCDEPADEGCHYRTRLQLQLPQSLPPVVVFRGFVGVDAVVEGAIYRVVNTHLEVREAGRGQDITAIQQAQAAELVDTIAQETPSMRPVILLGDFNSAPTAGAGSAYDIIHAAGYADTWPQNLFKALNPAGFTCCQASDLDNPASLLTERIDHIFVKNNLGVLPFSFTGLVVAVVMGNERIRDRQPRWSSDHAGPFAVLHGIPLFERHGRTPRVGMR